MDDASAVRALVDELVSSYDARDGTRLAELLHPDVTSWAAMSGRRTGRDATTAMLDTLGNHVAGGSTRTECVIAAADLAVAEVVTASVASADPACDLRFTMVVRIADAHIVELLVYLDPLHLLDEASVTAP